MNREEWKSKNPADLVNRIFWRYHPDLNWGIAVLQTAALPLGYGTKKMERMTRLELATSTLARWRSTRWATSANGAFGRNRTSDTRIFSPLLYQLSYKGIRKTCIINLHRSWRPGTGSNRRPLAWQASVLTSWTTGPRWWEQQGSNLWPPACKAGALPAELCSQILAVSTTASVIILKQNVNVNNNFSVSWFFYSAPV